jgi:hypothetical protein
MLRMEWRFVYEMRASLIVKLIKEYRPTALRVLVPRRLRTVGSGSIPGAPAFAPPFGCEDRASTCPSHFGHLEISPFA